MSKFIIKPKFVLFVVGAGIGSVVTWACVKKKYEQIAQEEIASVKDVFSKRTCDTPDEGAGKIAEAPRIKEKANVVEYAAKVRESGYTNYSDVDDDNKGAPDTMKKPYTISPNEFGELEGYDKITLTYYADKVLADDNDELVEDINDVVGFDALNSFGEYEDDAAYVRNERLACDFEILKEERKWIDVTYLEPPHQTED